MIVNIYIGIGIKTIVIVKVNDQPPFISYREKKRVYIKTPFNASVEKSSACKNVQELYYTNKNLWFLFIGAVATFRKGVRAIQMVGRASTYSPALDNFMDFKRVSSVPSITVYIINKYLIIVVYFVSGWFD